MTCKSSANPPGRKSGPTPFGWTDLTYPVHKNHVSWGYYLDHGAASDHHRNGVWVIWNVMPGFADVRQDGQAGNIRPLGISTGRRRQAPCRMCRGSRLI